MAGPTRRATSSTWVKGSTGRTTRAPTSGTCPTPKNGPPKTSFLRWTRRGNWPKPLGLSLPELRWLAFHRDAATRIHYRRFTIPKRDGSERAIWAPMPKLKNAQHWILRNVAEKLLVHGRGPRLPAGPIHLDQRRGRMPTRRSWSRWTSKTSSRPSPYLGFVACFARRGTASKSPRSSPCSAPSRRARWSSMTAKPTTSPSARAASRKGASHQPGAHEHALPADGSTDQCPGEAIRLAVHPICRRPDLQLAPRSQRQAQARRLDRHGAAGRRGRRVYHPPGQNPGRSAPLLGRRSRGLVVNGDQPPRVPGSSAANSAAIHNSRNGKPFQEGVSPSTLAGAAAYVYMTDPKLGAKFLEAIKQEV